MQSAGLVSTFGSLDAGRTGPGRDEATTAGRATAMLGTNLW
jgi:hypothetical protein